MRKSQIKLLEKAQKKAFTEEQLQILSDEKYSIEELKQIYNYFAYTKNIEPDVLVKEVKQSISYLESKHPYINNTKDYKLLWNLFFMINGNKPNTLLFPQKRRIYKMYQFIRPYTSEDANINRTILLGYYNCLQNQLTDYQIGILIRTILQNLNKNRLVLVLNYYPCFLDDFKYNLKQSMFYYLGIETDYFLHLDYSAQRKLENLYNYENHTFLFQKEDVEILFKKKNIHNDYYEYYIVPDTIYNLQIKQYPIIPMIRQFCIDNAIDPINTDSFVSTYYCKHELIDNDEKSLQKCFKILKKSFIVDQAAYTIKCKLSNNFFTNITYTEYNTIKYGTQYSCKRQWEGKSISYKIELMITPDGKLFKLLQTNKIKRYIPLSIKHFINLYKNNTVISDFIKMILNYHSANHYLYKDIIKDCISQTLIPLTFNEIAQYHNKKELLLAKYKKAQYMPIKWNKQNINLSYLLIKAYDLVEPTKSRQILFQQKTLPNNVSYYHYKNKGYSFLKEILIAKIQASEDNKINRNALEDKYRQELQEELQTKVLSDEYEQWINERIDSETQIKALSYLVNDYISMCKQSKTKIRLDIYSIAQLNNLHNKISDDPYNYRNITKDVKIPKQSKFLELREILPDNFEWIKTRKRLILETELQHHCVWSYADKITADNCAIYSFTDINAEHTKDGKPKRYTIEFCINKNGQYYINQVQGKYDAVNAHGMKEYIQTLLDEYTQTHNQNCA